MKNKNYYEGLNTATLGLINAIKTERNLKLEVASAIVILFASLFFELERVELVILVFTITLVIVAELINTSIEAALDAVFGDSKHELVKKAKDVAAAAVLVTSLNSLFVAYVLFYTKITEKGINVFSKLKDAPVYVTLICLVLVLILTLVVKTFTSSNKALKGGMPSGHSALGFALATSIGFLVEDAPDGVLIISCAYVLATLVAQSRVEGKIHSLIETCAGALLGIFISVLIFSIFG